MSEFLDKVVLLSSAVADADNHVMMHGRKLELLCGLESDIPNLVKSEIVSAQKKIEDLCLRILFQNCPNILIGPIVRVLSLLFSRGSNGSLHACVSHLIQLSAFSKDSPPLDRPIPGLDEDDTRPITIPEKSVCLQVASGLIVSRGLSASYFFPSFVSSVVKQMKLPDPAARDSAIRSLTSVIDTVGIPGSPLGVDIWKSILYKGLYQDKSPHVRTRSAVCLASFCRKCPPVALANSETILGIILKFLTSSAEQIAEQTGCVGILLLESRQAHVDALVELVSCNIDQTSTPQKITTNSLSLKSGDVKDLYLGFSFVFNLIRKYKANNSTVESLVSVLIRLLMKHQAKEEDCIVLCRAILSDVPLVSVASRAVARIVHACSETRGSSSVLRLASEVFIPLIRLRDYGGSRSDEVYVALCGFGETICKSPIVSLDSIISDLVSLIASTSSTSVAIQAAYTLRLIVVENSSERFSLANILLNHITIQNAELLSSSSSHLFVRSIFHFSLALSSIMCECVSSLPADFVGAIVNTANTLIDSEDLDMVNLQRKSCGYILLVPILPIGTPSIVPLLGMWRAVLGKKSKETISKLIMPGQTISDLGHVFEYLQAIQSCLKSIVAVIGNPEFVPTLTSDESMKKMFILLINNGLQILQALSPLEQSSTNAPHIGLVISGIRNELFSILKNFDSELIEPFVKPLISMLVSDLVRDDDIPIFDKRCFEDLFDPLIEEQPHLVWKYAFGSSVVGTLDFIGKPYSIRDFFSSPISCGLLEEFYSLFPTSDGSPWCPQVPYAGAGRQGLLSPQMKHPACKSTVIRLLANLVSFDVSLIDSVLPILLQKYRDQRSVTSQDYETARELVLTGSSAGQKESEQILKGVSKLPSSYILLHVLEFLKTIVQDGLITASTASSMLSFSASPVGLGAADPFVRRTSANLIALIYKSYEPLRPVIVQCVMDSSSSPVLRTRSASAALVGTIVSLCPSDISIFGNVLFKLARELQMPLRSSSLLAIADCSRASFSAISPWIKDMVKIVSAHAMADIYPSDCSHFLLSQILGSVAPVAVLSASDLARFDLLWTQFVEHSLPRAPAPFSIGIARACITYASASGSDEKLAFVKSCLGGYNVVVQTALTGLLEIVSKSSSADESAAMSVYHSLFVVAESYLNLQGEVDRLLKVMVRRERNLTLAIATILTMLLSRVVEKPLEDEYVESDEYDEEENPRPPSKKQVQSCDFRISCVSNKWLALKSIRRILKLGKEHSFIPFLDSLINVAVGAVTNDTHHEGLSKVGMKLVVLIIDMFGFERDLKSPQPLLLQYETQLLSVIRRGIRINSELSPEVQKLALIACKTMISRHLVTGADKLIELLIQPLTAIDPISTAPWSSYYALREISNSVVVGRSSPLVQSSELDLASVLFSRVKTIVDLAENGQAGLTDTVSVSRIGYFLIRLFIDCCIVRGKVHSSALGFTVLSGNMIMNNLVETDLIVSVLRGLAALNVALEVPSDCPKRDFANMKVMYCEILREAIQRGGQRRGDYTGPLRFAVSELGQWDMISDLGVFSELNEEDQRLAGFAKWLVRLPNHDKVVDSRLVWSLLKCGGTTAKQEVYSDVLSWLSVYGFFSIASDVDYLVNNLMLPMMGTTIPQSVVQIWRDVIDKLSSWYILSNFVQVVARVIENSADGKQTQFAIVLAIPMFSKICSISEPDADIVKSLSLLKSALVSCEFTPVVTQCVQKFISSSPPEWVQDDFLVPLVTEVVAVVGADAGADITTPLVDLYPTSRPLISFALQKLIAGEAEEKWGKIALSMMRSAEVFRACVSELDVSDRTEVENKIRKYLPVAEDTRSLPETQQSPKNQPPVIKLKMKFGK